MTSKCLERIKDIDAQLAFAQKNKHTETWRCEMRARKAQLEREIIRIQSQKSKNTAAQFDVKKQGISLALCGFPSAGKSSFLNAITGQEIMETNERAFTTLSAGSGMIRINGADIQLIDLPGILSATSKESATAQNLAGTGQIMSSIRSSNCILMFLNAPQAEEEKVRLEQELYDAGIRINTKPANISILDSKVGGIKVNFTVAQTKGLDYELAKKILQTFDYNNCTCTIKEDITGDELTDYIMGNRAYLPCIYVVNKIDLVTIESAKWFQENGYVPISCEWKLGFEYLKHKIWETMKIVRIYTKKKADKASLTEPIYLRQGETIEDVVKAVHKDLLKNFIFADVWGRSCQHEKQRCGLQHQVQDGDVVQINLK